MMRYPMHLTRGGVVRAGALLVLSALAALLSAGRSGAWAEPTDLGVDRSGHFITKKGKPILLLGDTVWPLAVRLKDRQIQAYLDDARRLGFNLVGLFETTTWAAYDDRGKNVFGDLPFRDGKPWQLGEKYWDRYEYVIREAGKRGIYVYFCVGGPLRPRSPWEALDTPRKAYDYGNALGRFFRHVNRSIIWSPGMDQNPETVSLPRVDDVAEGIADGVNGATKRDGEADYRSTFMSYHTCGGKTTADYFHKKPWLDFNGFQTWRSYELTVPLARKQYRMKPAKPGIDHEPAYEGDLSHREKEVKTGWHSRMQAYWSLFSGSCGHINGTTGIWDLGTRKWRSYAEGLRSEGRTDMQWVRRLLESKPLAGRVPDQSLIPGDPHQPDRDKDFICATRANDRSYAFIYSTNGSSFSIDLGQLRGNTVVARWYDPRTGKDREGGTFASEGGQSLDPPGSPRAGNDWVLILVGTDKKQSQ